jgi:hypothetical protein
LYAYSILHDRDTKCHSSRDKYYLYPNALVAIASAITAYARIEMSKYMNSTSYDLYYMDTYSIIINKQLPNNLIGNEIGKMRLENKIKEGYFIAPKIYYEDINNRV